MTTPKKSKSVVDLKQVKKEEKDMLKVINTIFEVFEGRHLHSNVIAKLKFNLSGEAAFDHHKFIKSITESKEAKAYFARKDELIKEFNEAQEKLDIKKRKPSTIDNIPGLKDLMEMDSGLEVEKHKIDLSKIQPDMIGFLMAKLADEKAAKTPNMNRIQTFEQQIEQEKARQLNGFDIDILALYYDLS